MASLHSLPSKLLDPEMSPLGFDASQMYHFLAVRFENTSANVQEQNLEWLQVRIRDYGQATNVQNCKI